MRARSSKRARRRRSRGSGAGRYRADSAPCRRRPGSTPRARPSSRSSGTRRAKSGRGRRSAACTARWYRPTRSSNRKAASSRRRPGTWPHRHARAQERIDRNGHAVRLAHRDRGHGIGHREVHSDGRPGGDLCRKEAHGDTDQDPDSRAWTTHAPPVLQPACPTENQRNQPIPIWKCRRFAHSQRSASLWG